MTRAFARSSYGLSGKKRKCLEQIQGLKGNHYFLRPTAATATTTTTEKEKERKKTHIILCWNRNYGSSVGWCA